jgi:carboxymethylenebutenolidase
MTRLYAVASLLMFVAMCVTCSAAQDWAKARLEKSPRHREYVNIKNGARTVQAFVVYPEVKEKAPVVLVIHEIFGLTDWVKDVADQLAEKGYIAMAPDLLSGQKYEGVDDAIKAISNLPPEQVTSDLNATADYAKKLPAASGKLMVAGFCWGGGQSFRFATNRKDLAAAFVFYGPPPQSGTENITAPVYGFYGGNDARINATIPDTEQKMKAAGKKYDPVTYEGAGHGFMRGGEDPNGKPADKKAHDEAWQRWLALMKSS